MRPISEADAEDYKRQDREEKAQIHSLERRRREPPIGEPCERCGGTGCRNAQCRGEDECPRCLGTGVQP